MIDALNYKLGNNLSFAEAATANDYCVWGMGNNEETHTWTLGKNSNITLRLDEKPSSDLLLSFDIKWVFNNHQRVNIFVNNHLCFESVVNNEGVIQIIIPKDYILEDKLLEIYLNLPDAISPASLGLSSDGRELALAFTSMIIEEV